MYMCFTNIAFATRLKYHSNLCWPQTQRPCITRNEQ